MSSEVRTCDIHEGYGEPWKLVQRECRYQTWSDLSTAPEMFILLLYGEAVQSRAGCWGHTREAGGEEELNWDS